jgi:hypothetical protein
MLSVNMLSVVIVSVMVLSVNILNVIMLSVVVPKKRLKNLNVFHLSGASVSGQQQGKT